MPQEITVDFSRFNAALADYTDFTRKEGSAAINRQLVNLAYHGMAAEMVSPADAAEIKGVSGESWWPKYVAKILAKNGGVYWGKRSFQAQWAQRQKGRKMTISERIYYKLAKEKSAQVIGRRTQAIGFLRYFWICFKRAAEQFAPHRGGVPAQPFQKSTRFKIDISPATPSNMTASAHVVYDYKYRGGASAASAQRRLTRSISQAMSATVIDMREYLQRKMAEKAKQISARAA